jgi:catechol 2,3-dioxygenase-like lactoylglutathione lyase family enzyme
MNPPFAVQKIGHAVVNVTDLEASKRFYTDVLGFRISDVYEGNKMPGGMVFLRCNGDHHCLALIGGAPPAGEAKRTLHHLAFELATLEFLDPDGHHLELYWGVDQIGYDGRSRPEEEWRQTMSLEDAVRIAPPGQDTTLHDKALADRIGAGTDRA